MSEIKAQFKLGNGDTLFISNENIKSADGSKQIKATEVVALTTEPTSAAEAKGLKIDGTSYKLAAGGVSDFDQLTNRPKYNGTVMTSSTDIPEVKTSAWDAKQNALTAGTNITISGNTINATAPTNMVTTDTAQTITGAKKFTNALTIGDEISTYGTIAGSSDKALRLASGNQNPALYLDFTGPLYYNNSCGTSGQVLTSGGTSNAPTWTTISGGTKLYKHAITGASQTVNIISTYASAITSWSGVTQLITNYIGTYMSGKYGNNIIVGQRSSNYTLFYVSYTTEPVISSVELGSSTFGSDTVTAL